MDKSLKKFGKKIDLQSRDNSLQGVTLAQSVLGPTYFGKDHWRTWGWWKTIRKWMCNQLNSLSKMKQLTSALPTWRLENVVCRNNMKRWLKGVILVSCHQPLRRDRRFCGVTPSEVLCPVEKSKHVCWFSLFPILWMFLFNFKAFSLAYLLF